jgi:SNF2 family DNA or RNA helicase
MITVTRAENHLVVRTPFHYKDVCKGILGARWSKPLKAWTYPATPSSARNVATALYPHASWTPDAALLLKAAERIADASAHKEATELPPIPITKTTPWLHQLRAYHFAKELSAAMLALEMGCGKTKVALDLLQNEPWLRTLILCPKSVVGVWPDEIARHVKIAVSVVALEDGKVSERAAELDQARAIAAIREIPLIVILNYEAAWREPLASALLAFKWDCVILDESHKIKAPGGKASTYVARLGERANKRLCLTGTPMPHSPLDLYGQYRFLDKGVFGTSFTLFRAHYAIMGGYGQHQVMGYQREDELTEKMYSLAYRVKADDVQSLPETLDIVRPFTLSRAARHAYDSLKQHCLAELKEGTVSTSNALALLLRLQQATSGYAKLDDGGEVDLDFSKREALADLLDGLPPTEPVVVFCRFHHDLDKVHEIALKLGRLSVELSGRVNALKPWQTGCAPILAVQEQSGGVGIDLSRACHAIYYSLNFSLGDYLQSRKRIHRPPQARPVRFYHLVATKTVDELIYTALAKRQNVVESVLNRLTKEQAQ